MAGQYKILRRAANESRPGSFLRLVALVLLLGCCSSGSFAAGNELVDSLTQKGLTIEGAVVKLPPPTMADGLDAAGQRKVIESIANANATVERLLERGVNSPFRTKFTDAKVGGASNSTIRSVDVWFVVYSDLETLASEGFLRQLGKPGSNTSGGEKTHQLTPDELKARGIEPLAVPGENERYVYGDTVFFDRVRATGTSRTLETRSSESILAAGLLDDRFQNDKNFPNRWQPLKRDDTGAVLAGAAKPYTGGGSYVKATKLHEPAGAVFVEYHVVYHEPYAWFDGANLIASKLPPILQDNVRKIRRQAADKKGALSFPIRPRGRRILEQDWFYMVSSCVINVPSAKCATAKMHSTER